MANCRRLRLWKAPVQIGADRVCGLPGERLRVPAIVGQSVFEVAVQNKVVIGDAFTCHVVRQTQCSHFPIPFVHACVNRSPDR